MAILWMHLKPDLLLNPSILIWLLKSSRILHGIVITPEGKHHLGASIGSCMVIYNQICDREGAVLDFIFTDSISNIANTWAIVLMYTAWQTSGLTYF